MVLLLLDSAVSKVNLNSRLEYWVSKLIIFIDTYTKWNTLYFSVFSIFPYVEYLLSLNSRLIISSEANITLKLFWLLTVPYASHPSYSGGGEWADHDYRSD
jgi:hypothetical protein